MFTLSEAHGILNKALNILTSNNINMTRIQSKPTKFYQDGWRKVNFHVDIEGTNQDKNVIRAIAQLELIAEQVTEVGTPEVPWFPTRLEDFDFIGKTVLGEGEGIQEADHPSFRDKEYRERRKMIADVAFNYHFSDPHIPYVDYTEKETYVWNHCYSKLKVLLEKNACDETNATMKEMEDNVEGFSADTIPQLEPISKYLFNKTGWRLKPVAGLLT